MAVREFDGTDDVITLALGGVSSTLGNGGAWTLLAVVKPTAKQDGECILTTQDNSNNANLGMYDGGGTKVNAAGSSYYDGPDNAVDTSWQILALSCSGTGVAVRSHRAAVGSSFTRANAAVWTVSTTTATRIKIGGSGFGAGEFKDMRIAVAAIFDSALSDGSLDGVATAKTTQSIYDLTPVALWDFNQASTGTAVEDLIGTSDQSAITGTTVVTTDDPSGWTFGVGGEPAVGPKLRFNQSGLRW